MELVELGESSSSCVGVGGVDSVLRIAWRCRLIAMQRSGPWVWCVRILRLLWSTFPFFEALLSFWQLESGEACFVDMFYIWAASALATRAF